MKVAFVCPFGTRLKGTVGARVLPMARSLAERGHRVLVLIPPWDSLADQGRTETQANLTLQHLSLGGVGAWRWPGLMGRLMRRAWAWQPDVLHLVKPKGFSGMAHTLAWAKRRLPAALQPRLVVDTDDWEGPGGWNELGGYSRVLQVVFARQETWGLGHADGVTVASRCLESLVWSLGVSPARVLYLSNALDAQHPVLSLSPWQPNPEAGRSLLIYSRFWEFDPQDLASRLRLLQERVQDLELVLAGKGTFHHEERLRNALADVGLSQKARWLGWVQPETLVELAAGTAGALAPLDDSLANRARCPAKLLELMGAGLPIAVDAVGEAPSLLDNGRAGWLLPRERGAWVESLATFLGAAQGRAALGARGRERVLDRYLWTRQAGELEQFYQSLA